MTSLHLSTEQARILEEYLRRVLSDLGVEIADTDRKDYRDEIKAERRLLEQILAQLTEEDVAVQEPPGPH